ncbi:response regulator transcription factor [Intestinirhabdus alba]|jgi:DNA-binding NarL/FixJ family response regulator|uniref:Helix-turn-helix transcriptional regulator n=1 Tax=Intestinirhabdus alba TaxID=2899544 RepID=A0A6L6IJQ6_9ENTR|nr:LuxR C-terminal-related transcriptional regulator [Intestinirhabdus alba]MTH47092.1 helix-turn-helix transcriptional regulator [Intestinirhabdus alba]
MLKILVIDRCHFTRTGLKAWLSYSELCGSTFLVSELNNLALAKEHILQWKPQLIIADLSGFPGNDGSAQYAAPFFAACGTRPLILLHADHAKEEQRYPAHALLSKRIPLPELSKRIVEVLRARPAEESPGTAAPLLTPQEAHVLTMWMEGVSHSAIARTLGIREKTVYTYKRNIRMKLHIDNRFSPFLAQARERN